MNLTAEKKQEIIAQHKAHDKDTGTPEVQIALLTEKIAQLTTHMQLNKKDFGTRRGLLMMVSKRASLLKYLKKNSPERYKKIIETLGLRK